MSGLKPCAHCGDSDYLTIAHCNGPNNNPEQAYVVCDFTKGGCGASGGVRYGEEQAIAAWNERAYEQRIAELEHLIRDIAECDRHECDVSCPQWIDGDGFCDGTEWKFERMKELGIEVG